MAGVGTKKIFENEQIVVWNLDLEPGEQVHMHTHKLDYVVRILSGSTLEVFWAGPAIPRHGRAGARWCNQLSD